MLYEVITESILVINIVPAYVRPAYYHPVFGSRSSPADNPADPVRGIVRILVTFIVFDSCDTTVNAGIHVLTQLVEPVPGYSILLIICILVLIVEIREQRPQGNGLSIR